MSMTNVLQRATCLLAGLVLLSVAGVAGHGRVMDPPQRSSMWRLNFSTPINYDDDALYCGGAFVQYNEINIGRCGECGDEWSLSRPRPNDEGGLYGTNTIGRTYDRGALIKVQVNLTTSHLGYFEFRLCPKISADQLVTQDCLDRHLLTLGDGSTRFRIPTYDSILYYPLVQLPKDISCEHCVLQWRYTTGNSWGQCEDGTFAQGCGNQETFINCSDIAIV